MAEVSRGRLIAIPALVTLAVTLLRLFGELQHWSPILFRGDPGGLDAVVGIIWLAPIFAVYFALKLVTVGSRPVASARAVVHAFLGVALFLGSNLLKFRLWPPFQPTLRPGLGDCSTAGMGRLPECDDLAANNRVVLRTAVSAPGGHAR